MLINFVTVTQQTIYAISLEVMPVSEEDGLLDPGALASGLLIRCSIFMRVSLWLRYNP
jgi:hypothetical protein